MDWRRAALSSGAKHRAPIPLALACVRCYLAACHELRQVVIHVPHRRIRMSSSRQFVTTALLALTLAAAWAEQRASADGPARGGIYGTVSSNIAAGIAV